MNEKENQNGSRDNRESRDKKLFQNEKCTICGAAAKGFKYGAISCEACRVFFRRLVKDRDDWLRNNSGREYDKIICTCLRIKQNHPDRDEEFIRYKCQKHRFEKCYKSGMDDAYVKGSINFDDQRTDSQVRRCDPERPGQRRTRPSSTNIDDDISIETSSPKSSRTTSPDYSSSRSQNDITIARPPSTSITTVISPSEVAGIDKLLGFWSRYIEGVTQVRPTEMQALASQLQNSASITPTNGMDTPDRLKTNLDSRCNALTYLKASLTDHKRAVDTIFDFMEPELKRRLSPQTKMNLVQSCVGELCVIRWCRTYERDENGDDSIVGLYGFRTTFRQIRALNFDQHFQRYWEGAEKLIRFEPDDLDLALCCALVVTQHDRIKYTREEDKLLNNYAEWLFKIFRKKCHRQMGEKEGEKKFQRMLFSVFNLRVVVKEKDIRQIVGYERKLFKA